MLRLLHQALIISGMAMTRPSYVNYFNLVGQFKAKHGPYNWIVIETFLSILRVILRDSTL